MDGLKPPTFGDEEKPNPNTTQAWLASLWLKKRLGIPSHLATAERVGTVMLAYGYLMEVVTWWLAEKKKQREAEENAGS